MGRLYLNMYVSKYITSNWNFNAAFRNTSSLKVHIYSSLKFTKGKGGESAPPGRYPQAETSPVTTTPVNRQTPVKNITFPQLCFGP